MENEKALGILILLAFSTAVFCDKVCYGPLGCFSNDGPFTSALLPQALLPEARDVINVTYRLYVRDTSSGMAPNPSFSSIQINGPLVLAYDDDLDHRWKSKFVVTKKTKIVIHDQGDSALATWVFAMVEKFLSSDDCQVITVGWQSRAGAIAYFQTSSNARVVGAEVALLLQNIKKWKPKFEFESAHLIGHGLGAHAASYAGEILKIDDVECMAARDDDAVNGDDDSDSWWQLPSWLVSSKPKKKLATPLNCPKMPQLGQITGLDPSGLWFETAGELARLDPSDAVLVDVIHTDTMSHFMDGVKGQVGNIDFYPNKGNKQPGCERGITGLEQYSYPDAVDSSEPPSCNHLRAISYYLSTIGSDSCPMTSFPCQNWNQMFYGKCTTCIHDFSAETSRQSEGSSWYSFLSHGSRRRRTSAPSCLKIGPTTSNFWQEHKRRAQLAGRDVTNIKALLETRPLAPYCVKYVRIELELNEHWSAGSLSLRFTDSTGNRTGTIKVGRISYWGDTLSPTYVVAIDPKFSNFRSVCVTWRLEGAKTWWHGFPSYSQVRPTRKDLRFPLRKIQISEPPQTEATFFCSSRRRIRSGHVTQLSRCNSEENFNDCENPVHDEQ